MKYSQLVLGFLFSFSADAAVSSKCSLSQLLDVFTENTAKSCKELQSKGVPPECQYYTLSELDQKLQVSIKDLAKTGGLTFQPETKLSHVYGTLLNGCKPTNKVLEAFDKLGFRSELNFKSSREEYEQACDANEKGGCTMFSLYIFYKGSDEEKEKARKSLNAACLSRNDPLACERMGYDAVKDKEYDLAIKFYQKFCDLTSRKSCAYVTFLQQQH